GYIPFFYFLIGIPRRLIGISRTFTLPVLLVSGVVLVVIVSLLQSIYLQADLSKPEGIFTYAVSSAYPISDLFLVVPATAAFVQLRKGNLISTPSAFIVFATILFVVGDLGFDYFVTNNVNDMQWIFDPVYIMGYLAIGCSLYWYKSFFTIDEKKMLRKWQEMNR